MDQPNDLTTLLDKVKSLIATQNLPGQHPSNTSTSTNHRPSPTVIPTSIPPLSSSCLTLPQSLSPSSPSSPLTTLTSLLQTHILPSLSHSSLSPNYYGFVIGGTTPAALLADILVSIYDQNVHVHLPNDTIATAVEVAALNLLVDLFRLPKEWRVGVKGGNGGGVFTTGATASNVLGLAVGREWVVGERGRRKGGDGDVRVSVAKQGLLAACREAGVTGIEVLSSMPHSSVVKAAAVLGIGRECVIDIGLKENPVGLDVDKLEQLARNMESQGKVYILVISAGEVNTGRFATNGYETMTRVRQICDRYGIWIHVDGAFGLFGRVLMNLSPEEQRPYTKVIRGVEGIELADSITGDGHKLLNVPYDCGLFFTRHKRINEVVFGNGDAAYLKTAGGTAEANAPEQNYEAGSDIQSPLNMGIENSRRFRALPVWATLMAYGRDGYVDLLKRQIGLARRVLDVMWEDERVEVLPKSTSCDEALKRTFMVVMFRAKDEVVNQDLVKRINATKRMYVSGTQWGGKPAARIAVSNWQVDVDKDSALIKEVIDECLG